MMARGPLFPWSTLAATLILLAATCLHSTRGAKILVVSSPLGFSHSLHMSKIADILARGDLHQVVYLRNSILGSSGASMKMKGEGGAGSNTNPRLIVLQDPGSERAMMELMARGTAHPKFGRWNQTVDVSMMSDLMHMVNRTCHEFLRRTDVWRQLREERFDVVLINDFGSSCLVGAARHYLAAPLIYYSTVRLTAGASYLLNVPLPPSYAHLIINPAGAISSSSILQRAANLLNYAAEMYMFLGAMFSTGARVVGERLGGAAELETYHGAAHSSLILVVSDWALDRPRPLLPNVVLVGGALCTQPKPLPQELEQFMSPAAAPPAHSHSAPSGVVYVAFGTTVSSSVMGRGIMDLLIDTFSLLPEYRVLWKLDITPDWRSLPDNVKLVKWAPQQDVLGHPNTKVFVSHGGLNSVYEALYHVTPTLVLPVLGDQEDNAASLVATGMALTLDKNNLHADTVAATIRRLYTDPRYKSAAMRSSSILKDHPQSAADRLRYWVDYVVRHKGAPHLKVNTGDMSALQYFNVDIFCLLALILITCAFIVWKMIRRCCCSSKTATSGIIATNKAKTN